MTVPWGSIPLPGHVSFRHVVVEGTSYDVGKLQGHMLKEDPEQYKFITSLPPGINQKKYSKSEFKKIKDFFTEYCPGINEEIKGTADALGAVEEDITYYYMGHSRGQHCSHFAVLSPISEDGHTYAGRNYDLHPACNDLRLCTTHVKGYYSHIGFSEDFFGRTGGMNEEGLCITTSLAAEKRGSVNGGFRYHAVVRTVLDRCKTVDEAVEIIQQIPISDYQNFIVTDCHGESALVEIACSKKCVNQIDQNSQTTFLCATNHYTLPEMIQWNTGPKQHSVIRYKTIEKRLKGAIPQVSRGALVNILSDPFPEGVCCQHYSGFLGTLWSVIFDVTDIKAEICFGTPHKNEWRSFGLDTPPGITKYTTTLVNKPADPAIWRKVALVD